jgi:hypothetical protein
MGAGRCEKLRGNGCWTFGPAVTPGSGRYVRWPADLHASCCPVLRQWRRSDELICRADEPAGVLETAGCFAAGGYAVAVMPVRSVLACHSRAAAVVS